jgi:hypothetical protein
VQPRDESLHHEPRAQFQIGNAGNDIRLQELDRIVSHGNVSS